VNVFLIIKCFVFFEGVAETIHAKTGQMPGKRGIVMK